MPQELGYTDMMGIYELSNIIHYYIQYKGDKYGPTAISIKEMVDFIIVFDTGWTRKELTKFVTDWYNN